jgi:iron complex outermembrane receptor protein
MMQANWGAVSGALLRAIDHLRVLDAGRFLAASLVLQCFAVSIEPASAAQPDEGEAIVVTAQRRPERLEDVPIFLTAISGVELERMQATDMATLGKVAPSLHMTRTGAFTQPFLRGVGKRSTLGVENSVATYMDGVYLASSISALLDLRGIDRVEVLNGPQGTLFGRNTPGGVIQIVTRDPDPAMNGEAELHAGTYGYVRGDVYLTGGNDWIAGNLAVSLSRNGGYGTNLFNGNKDQGEVDHSLVVRNKWIWRPDEGLKLTLAGDYQDIEQDFTQLPVAGFQPVGNPRVLDFRDSDHDGSNRMHFKYGGGSLKAEAAIGGINFMSLTALRLMHARYHADLDVGPRLLLFAAPDAEQKQFSQEFQLQSPDEARLRWVAGVYYIHLQEQYDPTIFRYGGGYSVMLGGRIFQTLSDIGKMSSYAAYGQATLPIGEATRLTGGLRYTIEKRSVEAFGERLFDNPPFVRPIPGLPLPTDEPLKQSDTFHALTWRASFDHDFSNALMGYASVSRGFQSGGWNLQTPQIPAFGPEKLDNYEAGLKYVDGSGRFRADAAIFYYDYSDLQLSAFTPIGSITTNAASADIYGLDAQFSARMGDRTNVTLGAQWLNARFNRFANATCTNYSPDAASPYLPELCDVTGNRLPFAPKFKANLGGNYRFSLGRSGTLLLSGNLAHNSGYFSEVDNVVRQDAYTTVDFSAEWRPARRGPSIRLWVLNLTDAHYHDTLVTFPTTGVLHRPAAPRRFGVSAGYSF